MHGSCAGSGERRLPFFFCTPVIGQASFCSIPCAVEKAAAEAQSLQRGGFDRLYRF